MRRTLTLFIQRKSVLGLVLIAALLGVALTLGGATITRAQDGRIDPRPGDRIAVYCRAEQLDVWGITDVGMGLFLASFPYTELRTSGSISRTAGGLGTVVASLTSDGVLTAAWSGGPYFASGFGDFAKRFRCSLAVTATPTPPIYNPYFPPYNPYVPGYPGYVVTPYPPYNPYGVAHGFYYVVQPGDTLYRISRRFGVSLYALLAANPAIVNPSLIYIGQRIFIP